MSNGGPRPTAGSPAAPEPPIEARPEGAVEPDEPDEQVLVDPVVVAGARLMNRAQMRAAGLRNQPKEPLDHEPEAVTYARRQAGLTKAELARRCGVSPSLITEIEGGTRNATPATIRKLAQALNCPRVVLERKRDYASGSSHG